METLKPCPTCGRFYKNAPDADPRPAAQPGVEGKPMGETRCFECGHELTAPYCPACRPAPSLPEDVERVVERLEEPHHMDRLDAEAAALIRTLSSQLAEARATRRWNVDDAGREMLAVCRDLHEKGEECEWETWVPLSRAEKAEADRDRLAAENERKLAAAKEALNKIHNCGQSAEPDHWKFRQMAREQARAALASLGERT